MSKKKADKKPEQKPEPDHLVKIIGGSSGTITGAKVAAITAGAVGATEIPLEDEHRKITWNGTLLELVALLELLEKAGYISTWDSEHAPSLMQHHFLNGGQEIKPASVRTMKYEDYPDHRLELMDKIHQRLIDAIEELEQPEE